MANRETIIRRVQALWRQAEDSSIPGEERDEFVRKANELMAKYQIEEIVLNQAKSADNRENVVLVNIRITEDGRVARVPEQRIALVAQISKYNRVRCVVKDQYETVDDSGCAGGAGGGDVAKRVPGGRFVVLVGYESDVAFVRELFFGVGLDMMQAMMLEPSQRPNYQQEFCAGFVTRIGERLAAMEQEVKVAADGVGMGLVLVSRQEVVVAEFNKAFPNLVRRRVSSRSKYDPAARGRGGAAANTSDLGQSKVSGGGSRKELS